MDDLVTLNRDVVVDDEGIGETCPVEVTIDSGRNYDFAVAVGDVDDFESDLGIHDFVVAPRLNRADAAELPAYVVDNGTVGEESDERGSIVVVDCLDLSSGSLG